MARLLIVDGHAYAYRAFYAIRQLSSPTGEPTNAIYGFIKMLEKMQARISPTHLLIVWDGGLAAERVAALPEYKTQRPPIPPDLDRQIEALHRYLEAARSWAGLLSRERNDGGRRRLSAAAIHFPGGHRATTRAGPR